jgi:RsiW-degrading membrane proteinase PrsW (M82 family)
MLSRTSGMLAVICIGVAVLFAFFMALGAVKPSEVVVPTVIVGALAVLFMVRALVVRHRLGEHGNQEMFRTVNALRERRGF